MKNKELFPPNRALLKHIEELCTLLHPYQKPDNYDSLFTNALVEIIRWHQEKSIFYRQFLRDQSFDPSKWSGNVNELPFLPAEFFKFHEVKSIADSEVLVNLTSSGTSGQKSQMFFDKWSLGSAQQMVDFIYSHYNWITENPSNYLLYSYQTESNSKLGTSFTDNFLTKYSPVKKVEYALKINGKGGHDFDIFGCIRSLQNFAEEGLPVRIFGFPSFFYFTLLRIKDLGLTKLTLNPDSFVFLGGGWKGFANQEIKKQTLYTLAEDLLGIPNARLRDGFGSVEHCVPYIECSNHNFHVPIYSKVIIRDVKNLSVLGYDLSGFLQFISPYITSSPAHSVMMGDLAVLHSAKSCGCDINTDWFEILGRAGTSKNKSCAIAAADLLRDFV